MEEAIAALRRSRLCWLASTCAIAPPVDDRTGEPCPATSWWIETPFEVTVGTGVSGWLPGQQIARTARSRRRDLSRTMPRPDAKPWPSIRASDPCASSEVSRVPRELGLGSCALRRVEQPACLQGRRLHRCLHRSANSFLVVRLVRRDPRSRSRWSTAPGLLSQARPRPLHADERQPTGDLQTVRSRRQDVSSRCDVIRLTKPTGDLGRPSPPV